MAVRAGIYALMPITTWWQWFLRDSTMDLPRLMGFAAALSLGGRTLGRGPLGWHGREAARGVLFGGLLVAVSMLDHVRREQSYQTPLVIFVGLALNSLCVALFEETSFRGVILRGLSEWRGPIAGVWGSSLLFAVYHVQAQPLSAWLWIFLFGVATAVLAESGVGLWWLVLAHAALDTLVFLGSHGDPVDPWWPALSHGAVLLLVAVLYVTWRRRLRLDSASRPLVT